MNGTGMCPGRLSMKAAPSSDWLFFCSSLPLLLPDCSLDFLFRRVTVVLLSSQFCILNSHLLIHYSHPRVLILNSFLLWCFPPIKSTLLSCSLTLDSFIDIEFFHWLRCCHCSTVPLLTRSTCPSSAYGCPLRRLVVTWCVCVCICVFIGSVMYVVFLFRERKLRQRKWKTPLKDVAVQLRKHCRPRQSPWQFLFQQMWHQHYEMKVTKQTIYSPTLITMNAWNR